MSMIDPCTNALIPFNAYLANPLQLHQESHWEQGSTPRPSMVLIQNSKFLVHPTCPKEVSIVKNFPSPHMAILAHHHLPSLRIRLFGILLWSCSLARNRRQTTHSNTTNQALRLTWISVSSANCRTGTLPSLDLM